MALSFSLSYNKNMKHPVTLLAAALLLAACSNDQEQIKQSAYGYLDAMGNYRPTDARPYATQQTCDVTLAFYENVMEYTDSSVYSNNIPAEITIGEIIVADDTTATAAFHKSTPTVQQDGTVHLVKRQGRSTCPNCPAPASSRAPSRPKRPKPFRKNTAKTNSATKRQTAQTQCYSAFISASSRSRRATTVSCTRLYTLGWDTYQSNTLSKSSRLRP